MPLDIWGSDDQNPLSINNAAGAQTGPVVADNGGAEFGVAWFDGNSITVSFFDEQGKPNAVLPSVTVTDGIGSNLTDLQMIAGGSGLGYGIAWSENNGGVDQLKLRYYDGVAGGLLGGEISISSNGAINQHDLSISGFGKDDAAGRPITDGFDAVWVEGAGGAHALGSIYVQRFAVPLNAVRDPSGPPAAAGIDGTVGAGGDGQTQITNNGRDPSVAGLHAHVGGNNETVVTWIDANNRINIRIYNDNGTVNNSPLGVATNNLNTAAAPMVAGSQQHVIALQGGGFLVAWVATSGANNFIAGRVFTAGVAAGTFTGGPVVVLDTLDGASNTISDFSLAALETGGFTVSWTALDDPDGAGAIVATQAVHIRSYTAGGVANELVPSIFHAPADATNVASTGLIGDRVITVYQDNSTPGDASNIGARIFDTRLDAVGNPIVLNGAGVTLIGDPEFETRGRIAPDILVGSIGNDIINGRQAADILDGGLGNDRILASAGDDTIDGGGNSSTAAPGGTLADGTALAAGGDTVVFTGRFLNDGVQDANDDYIIQDLGGGVFQVTDLRGGGDGVDFIRNVEWFEFLGNAPGTQVISTAAIGAPAEITPSAWGWTNEDADNAPNALGAPDVDGFIVNPNTRGGVQQNVSVADSVGEFIAVVWENATAPGADTHIRGQFFDVILAPDAFIPNTMDISDGIGIETNPIVASGGANSGWAVAWEQLDNASDVSHTLRTNFVGPGQLTSVELSVLDEGAMVDQHDAAIFGSFLDRTLSSPVGGSVLPTGMNEGYNVVWTSTHLDGADGPLPADYGRIMMQRFEVPLDELGNPGAPVAGGVDGIAGLDNVFGTMDAAVWIGDEDANGIGGALGRNASTASLHGFETAVIWIEQDGAGGERVAGRAYDDLGQVIPVTGFDNISGAFSVAAGTNAYIVSAGAVNLGIVWVTANPASPSGLTVMGTMYAPTGAGLNGVGFGFAAPAPFALFDLPAGVTAANLELAVTGISGEDSEDVVVSWNNGSGDVMARHIAVTLDPVTGQVISMETEGAAVQVNAESAGNQSGASIAGLLGDRFITVYQDNNGGYTDGNDLVARVIDTRDAVNPDPIIGDLIRAGIPQARRDVLIGTNGNDNIRGDISDSDGAVDWIYAGMGDDVIQGGPGLRGAAGIPEIIDGGEGNDTAVYTGRLQDYSITINGDGSYEVIDLRPDGAGTLVHDGIDNLYSIENIRFLDLANGGAGAQTITFGFPGSPPPLDPSYDGTPVAWSLDDTTVYKEIHVDVDPTPGDAPGQRSGIAVTNLQDGAGLAWVAADNAGANTQVWAITYDTSGQPDPVLLDANTQLTDGGAGGIYLDNLVGDIDVAMTGGLGMTAVWESTDVLGNDSTDTSLHLAFASTNTHIVLNPAGGAVPGPGIPGGEIVVVGTAGAGIAVDPSIQGYEIVDVNNSTLEVGFHVGFVTEDDGVLDTSGAGDGIGALMIARYEIPVYDILVDAAGLPILDGAGQGQLATDAFGNFIPSTTATFGVGSETAPISIGLDGLRGTADDAVAIALTDQGLFAANTIPVGANVLQGRDLTMGSLHDGQLVVSYVDASGQVNLRIYLPTVNQAGDRETGGVGTDVVAQGVTTYSQFAVPFPTALGSVAPGQTAMTVAQQNGSFGVFWGASDGAGGIAIQGIIYSGAGSNWSPSPVVTFATGLPANVSFQVAPTGVTPGGLEDGFFVSWESAGAGIQGQRFNMTGAAVGGQITVGDPTSGTPGAHSTAGIDDGRMIVGYVDGNDVSAQYLDNRQSGVTLIGPRTGAPRDVIAGTVGDDALDGRALGDELYGGLGDDLITMGTGADLGLGGEGADTIIGGGGQDQLLGEAGDDLLWGGQSGPSDPFVNRDLETGLTAAGVSAALIATNPGADIVSGGAGEDTISFQGEFGAFNINLASGIVTSDRDQNGSFILEDVIGQIVDDGAGGFIFTFINDVENATGGIGNDTLIGNAGDNVLRGGGGDNIFDGGGGVDTVVIDGIFATYTFHRVGGTVTISDGTDTQTVSNTEFLQFEDRRVSVANLFTLLADGATASGGTLAVANANSAPTANNDAATVLQGHTVVIKALANDDDPDGGQALTITQIDGQSLAAGPVTVANGTVSLMSNGALAFTANGAFAGVTGFSYTISDGFGGVAIANVSVNVTSAGTLGVNDGAASLSISGLAAEDQVLTANLGVDPDGVGTPATFQWFLNGVAIGGATNATYAVALGDVGGVLTVQANYTDGEGFAESVTSAPTATVVAQNDGASAVTITGVAAEHQTLTANVGADPDGDGAPPTFQWFRNGVAIAGATGATYTLVGADTGRSITVQALYTDAQGFSEGPVSAAVGPVTAVNDGAASVTVTGSTSEHGVLSANVGADPDGNGALSYQWLRNGVAIAGATSATYASVAADVGASISVRVNYTDAQGFAESVTSAGTAAITAVNDGASSIAITGSAIQGQTLTRVLGADPDGAGSAPTTQWLRNGVAIAGATGATYVLTATDVGAVITVRVSYTDGQGFGELVTSAGTAPVAPLGGLTINGTNGNDTLNGGALNDTINGLNGNDAITGNGGGDVVNGGGGNDTIFATIGDGNDAYDGGAGTGDTYNLAATSADANVNLATGAASSAQTGVDSLLNFENITSGSGNDILTGDGQTNIIIGGAGNDTLSGGTAGNDSLRGGLGDDAYIIDRSGVSIVENAGEGTDTVQVSLASYTLGANIENLVFTGAGAINATGNGSNNVMTGGAGGDTLGGGNGNDTLFGGLGADILNGNAGDDFIFGGGGNDTMNGGTGNDRFIFEAGFGADTISGFDANATGGQDLLDLTALGITSGTFAANVTITDLGADTLVTIAGVGTITLLGVNGTGANVITIDDFILGP